MHLVLDPPPVPLNKGEAKRSAIRPNQENSQQLVTGLVLARETTLKHLISHVLGIGSDQSNYFPLHQGTISLIHYPSSKESPMLQSLNIASPISGRT
ncbi:MAG: hypothetical protein AAGF26_00770 [Cyanobacteria bacterium P01_G01_bin.49]